MNRVINCFIIVALVVLYSCKTTSQQKSFNPIRDTPKEIKYRYGIDLVPDKKVASSIAEVIWKSKHINHNFEYFKPFEVNSIANDKVWEIIAKPKKGAKSRWIFHMKINKNTGEVLNNWVVK